MKKVLLSVICILLSACQPLTIAPPLPTPQTVIVSISPGLEPIHQPLYGCASNHEDIALLIEGSTGSSGDLSRVDFAIQLGEPSDMPPDFIALLGWEEVIVTSGAENEIESLDKDTLKQIYLDSQPIYPLWTYPSEYVLRVIFDAQVLDSASPSPYTLLAPDPGSMQAVMLDNPKAIGYLPKAFLIPGISQIDLDYDLQDDLRLPVLVLAEEEPQEAGRTLLFCLQEGEMKDWLEENYSR